MNIDFVKWLCDKAEGFSIEPRYYPDGIGTVYKEEHEQINDTYKETTSWEILLQRAIEGVNRRFFCEGSKICPWIILNNSHGYKVYYQVESSPRVEYMFDFPCKSADIDKAKEAALMYIYEQETTK